MSRWLFLGNSCPDTESIMKNIIEYEYELYKNRYYNVDNVFFTLEEFKEKFKDIEKKCIDDLVSKGLVREYEHNGTKVYRSIYFDVIQDYIGIRESSTSKITVMDYKILEPRKSYLPKWDQKADDLINEITQIMDKHFRNLDENTRRIIRNLPNLVLKLRSKYSKMQARAIKSIFNELIYGSGKAFIISAPTGWGKTEAFFIPALLYTMISKIINPNYEGIRVIIVYPRKALASNQLKRFIKDYISLVNLLKRDSKYKEYFQYLPLISIRDGQSIKPGDYKSGEPFRIRSINIDSNKRCDINIKNIREIAVKCGDEEYILPITNTHIELENIIPDILIINLDMLNRALSSPRFAGLWKSADQLSCIIFDEAHVYSDISFLHFTYLLRRLKVFLEEVKGRDKRGEYRKPVLVFSSATIPKNYSEELEKALGVTIEKIDNKDSEDKKKFKIEIPVIIAPRPNVAGQWIAQLIALYNVLLPLHMARTLGTNLTVENILDSGSIPYKSIFFIDSLSGLFDIRSYLNTLLDRMDVFARNHMYNSLDPSNRDHWSFVDKELVKLTESIRKKEYFNRSVRTHYGDLDQETREKIEEEFQTKLFPVLLLSTSTLELGIDIPDIWQIIQFRPPISSDSFIQRIGRAGRSEGTYHIALGVLILTNQPSDIAYLIDEKRQNELFGLSELRVPVNDTIRKQHLMLSILDYLNTLVIKGEIRNDQYIDALNSFYYTIQNRSLRDMARDIVQLINKWRDKIIDYIKKIEPQTSSNTIIEEFVEDLNRIHGSLPEEVTQDIKRSLIELRDMVLSMLGSSGFLPKLHDLERSERVKEYFEEGLHEFVKEFGKVLENINLMLNESIKDVNKILDLDDVMKELKDLNDQFVIFVDNKLISLSTKVKDKEFSELLNLLIGLSNKVIEIEKLYSSIDDYRNYVEYTRRVKDYEEVVENMFQFLALALGKGTYSAILREPVKHLILEYYGERGKTQSRNESIFMVFKRLANLKVDKRPREG